MCTCNKVFILNIIYLCFIRNSKKRRLRTNCFSVEKKIRDKYFMDRKNK